VIYRRIYDPALAQASYLVACDETREAVLVDPERDIDRYEREAEDAGVRIVAVAETHLHADFVSGVRAFVASRPVTAYMSGVGSRAPWTAEGPFHAGASMRFLCDGDEFRVGSLRFRARHTPGHTREALSFEFVGEQGASDDREADGAVELQGGGVGEQLEEEIELEPPGEHGHRADHQQGDREAERHTLQPRAVRQGGQRLH